MADANTRQVGGAHYGGAQYQHWDWVDDNNLCYLAGVATKYICRWKTKDGRKDLEKALHYVQKLQELRTAHPERLGVVRRCINLERIVSLYNLTNTETLALFMLTTYTNTSELETVTIMLAAMLEVVNATQPKQPDPPLVIQGGNR
jgi:hypothetical protein